MSTVTETIQAVADLQIEAAGGKQPKLSILANTGSPMKTNVGMTLIDLSGLELPATTVVLANHKNETGATVGSGSPSIRNNQLLLEGQMTMATEAAAEILQLYRDGVPLQASVGVDPIEAEPLRPGTQVTVNGRTHQITQPTLLVKRGQLFEVTIVPNGADRNTSVSIAAKRGNSMSALTDDTAHDAALTTEPDVAQIERERASTILAAANGTRIKGANSLAQQAIEAGHTVEQFQAALLQRMKDATIPTVVAGGATRSGAVQGVSSNRNILAAAALIHAGRSDIAEKEYTANVLSSAEAMGTSHLMDLVKNSLVIEGRPVPSNRDESIKASFTSTSLPNALGDAANKTLVSMYNQLTPTWRSFAGKRTTNNFHQQTGIRPAMVGGLEELANDGEIKHATLDETAYSWSIDTFAKMISVTRKHMINDDTGFFNELPAMFANMASRSLSTLVWSGILANAGSFFGSGNNNHLTGAASALDIESLDSAIQLMRTQKDGNGQVIDMQPAVLVVGPKNETKARTLIGGSEINQQQVSRDTTMNPMQGVVQVVVEPRIEGSHENKWFLFASTNDPAVVVGFLNGIETPTINSDETAFHTLGQQWRCYHDYGTAFAEHRAAVMSDGE